jgi:hypothetical protein
MRVSRLVAVAALALAAAAVLPAQAASPGKGHGHAYGHEKPKHAPDISDSRGCVGNPSDYSLLEYSSGGQTAKAHNVLYSVSMGGNTAGLALAAKPKRQGGRPLFDEWVDVEGAADVTETYLGARVLSPVNAFAANATADIEAEMGGPLESRSSVFAQRTVVNRTTDIVASGIKGVVMVHGYADGLVTHDISRQLQALLRAQGMPVDFRSFLTHSKTSESGTTLDGYLPTGMSSPFAGHASEVSETQDVGVEGFRALGELYAGQHVRCRDTVTDGMTGQGVAISDGCA